MRLQPASICWPTSWLWPRRKAISSSAATTKLMIPAEKVDRFVGPAACAPLGGRLMDKVVAKKKAADPFAAAQKVGTL